MGLIKYDKPKEGEIINKWIYNRMIARNKNILTATTGSTGSGKSYQDLRRLELWYLYHFKKKPPIENVCFSIGELMKRLTSGELKKGELLILEEAGANLGSLDFQSKVSKMFTYVLQTFRSQNVGILFNLPYLTMLNKQARTLIHVHFETLGIDNQKNTSKFKAFFRQVNPTTGKVYNKHFRTKANGKTRPIKKFTLNMPSQELINAYEKKKAKFVIDLSEDFNKYLDEVDKETNRKMARDDLTETQREIYNWLLEGKTTKEIAEIKKTTTRNIDYHKKEIKNKGFKW